MPPEIIKTELVLSLVTLAVFGTLLAADLLNRHAAKRPRKKDSVRLPKNMSKNTETASLSQDGCCDGLDKNMEVF